MCLFSAMFGGTRGLISGSNMFSALTMLVVVTEYTDNLTEALTVAMLAGLMQIAFGTLRLGRYISYTPSTLLSGFFTASGILLITSQISGIVGFTATGGSVISSAMALPGQLTHANYDAVPLRFLQS